MGRKALPMVCRVYLQAMGQFDDPELDNSEFFAPRHHSDPRPTHASGKALYVANSGPRPWMTPRCVVSCLRARPLLAGFVQS